MLRRDAVGLIAILLVAGLAVAVLPQSGLVFGDEVPGDEAGREHGQAGHADPGSDAANQDASPAPSSDDPVIQGILEATEPSQEEPSLADRLEPILHGSPAAEVAAEIPGHGSLYAALAAHPASTQRDLAYAESIAPLPPRLDQALAHVVSAHAVATGVLNTQAPNRAQVAAATLAVALDEATPVLTQYIDHPIWDEPASTDAVRDDAATFTLDPPPLPDALLSLYGSLGLDPSTVQSLEPAARAAATELSPGEQQAVAVVVDALAAYQQAVGRLAGPIALAASHSDDPAQGALDDVDQTLDENDLQELRAATEQVRTALTVAQDTLNQTPADDVLHREAPWSGPLGLIVLGTPGNDTFDATLGASETGAQIQAAAASARETVGPQGVNASLSGLPVPFVEAMAQQTRAGAAVDPAGESNAAPAAGWHMAVIDPGGDDVYLDNAGGIDAGAVTVEVEASTGGVGPDVRTLLLDENDRLCVPVLAACEPGTVTTVGPLLALAGDVPASATTSQVPTGIPMVSVVLDAGGDDTYLPAGEVTQGSARGLALGLLLDADGDDHYQATRLAQGSSEAFGHGELIDLRGNDTYRADERAQAWTNVPNPKVGTHQLGPVIFGPGFTEATLVNLAYSGLTDLDGTDAYVLDDLRTGQGILEVDENVLRGLLLGTFAGTQPDRNRALLVDVGGQESLPVPTSRLYNFIDEAFVEQEEPPTHVNASGYTPAETWINRWIYQDGESQFDLFQGFRVKNAIHATTDTLSNPAGGDTIRVGSIQVQVHGCQNTVPKTFACIPLGTDGSHSTPPLFLTGQPTNVTNPPVLTLTFGGDTHYEGTIAATNGAGESPVGVFGGFVGTLPSFLVDLAGNDVYEGGNETVGYAEDASVALLVDRVGHDEVHADDRSLAYATEPQSIAAVLDLDGRINATTGQFSQAAAKMRSDEPLGNQQLHRIYDRPQALLHLAGPAHTAPGGSTLAAGNLSQGYVSGLANAFLVGSPGNDAYTVDGWGQGFFDGQQLVYHDTPGRSLCPANIPNHPVSFLLGSTQPNRIIDSEGWLVWSGGLSLLVDPAGDDTYTASTPTGAGDAHRDVTACEAAAQDTTSYVNVPGMGLFADATGHDVYHQPDTDERPAFLGSRSCSGDATEACRPSNDRAWTTQPHNSTIEASEQRSTDTPANADLPPTNVETTVAAPTVLGTGVDNVRNLHHALAALCRGLTPAESRLVAAGASQDVGSCEDVLQETVGSTVWSTLGQSLDLDPEIQLTRPEGTDEDFTEERRNTRNLDLSRGPAGQESEPARRALQTRCEDPRHLNPIAPRAGPAATCISISHQVSIGEWISQRPHEDPNDPGDLVACNCSGEIEIQPDQGGRISLGPLQARGLYPVFGERATSLTHDVDTWYRDYARFRAPASAVDRFLEDPAPDVSGLVQATADFPMNLSAFPRGLTQLEVTAEIQGVVSEETGGLAPVRSTTESVALVHERAFTDAYQVPTEDGVTVLLAAPGPVDADATIQLTLTGPPSEDTLEALEDAGWERAGETTFTTSLPRTSMIDAPSRTLSAALLGPRACSALLAATSNFEARPCWTGEHLVVGWHVEDLPADVVQAVGADETLLEVTPLESPVEGDAEPVVRYQSEDAYDVRFPSGKRDVHGVPGTRVLEEGRDWMSAFVGERVTGKWARIDVVPSEPGALGIGPAGTSPQTEVKVWHTPDERQPVALGGEVVPGSQSSSLTCHVLGLSNPESVRDAIVSNGRLDGNACVVVSNGTTLTYVLPLGEQEGTRIVEFGTTLLRSNGEVVPRDHAVHVDPVGARGQIILSASRSKGTVVDATLQLFRETTQDTRLQGGDDGDVVGAHLEIRKRAGEWMVLTDALDDTPTRGDPKSEATLDFATLFDDPSLGEEPVRVEIRGVVQDESNNTVPSRSGIFLIDRRAPRVTNVTPVSMGDQTALLFDLDEDAKRFSCVGDDEDGCPISPVNPVPGLDLGGVIDPSGQVHDTKSVQVPVVGLVNGPTYNATFQLEDALGNNATREIQFDTSAPLEVDASPMEGMLVNRTITFNWTSRTLGDALETSTNAYIVTEDDSCPVLQGYHNVLASQQGRRRSIGPLPMPCDVPENGTGARLVLWTFAARQQAIATTSVDVHVDTFAPNVTIDAPEAWTNRPVTAKITAEDPLSPTLALTVDGEPTPVSGAVQKISLSGEGEHTIVVEAADRAGNTITEERTIRIDRTPPTMRAHVEGVHRGIALVELNATDRLSGVRAIQLASASGEGPEVPVVQSTGTLLSLPVAPSDDRVSVRAIDEAGNVRQLRLDLEQTGRLAGREVGDLTLTPTAPDALEASFVTARNTTPVLLVDAGSVHEEQTLDKAIEHTVEIDELPPGSTARVTVALPEGASLVPVANATVDLPADETPPGRVQGIQTSQIPGGVRLTWAASEDDTGVRHYVIRRGGEEVARVQAPPYIDRINTAEELEYDVSAVDLAGNAGPGSTIAARAQPQIEITDLTTNPPTPRPGTPVTVTATVDVPDQLDVDLVTLSTWAGSVPMERVQASPGQAVYAANVTLPALNVTTENPSLWVTVDAEGQTREARFPAPLVSLSGPATGASQPSDVPMPGVSVLVALLAVAAVARRWSE